MIAVACGAYVISAFLSLRLGKKGIGPQAHEVSKEIAGFSEMFQGFKTLREHGDALRGIFATATQRGSLTALTLAALLLERNTFNASNNPDAGLRGFAFILVIAGIGVGVGSFLSPIGVLKFGRHYWIKLNLIAPIPFLVLFSLLQNRLTLALTGFVVAGFGQSLKVANDALVQSKISDIYRGRVFAFYDVAVNGAIVLGAVVSALVLPTSGKSLILPILICLVFIICNSTLLAKSNFSGHSHPTK